MTRAACLGVLQYLMKGASGASTYFAMNWRKALASRPRPVLGLKPGSTALKRKRGVSREREDRCELALLGGGVGVLEVA